MKFAKPTKGPIVLPSIVAAASACSPFGRSSSVRRQPRHRVHPRCEAQR